MHTFTETLSEFARRHRLRVANDSGDNTKIIVGAFGQVYEHGSGRLGVMFILPNKSRPRAWASAKKRGIAVGMRLIQNGDAEGCLAFDPNNEERAELAIRIAGVNRKRQLTDDHRAALAKRIALARRSSRDTDKNGGIAA